MSSKHHYCRTADEEINSPELFLPTSLRFNDINTYWTQQAYALFSKTQTPKEVPSNWRETEPKNPQLPPRMHTLKQQEDTPEHATAYINEFIDASRMVQAWYKSQPANKIMAEQIGKWTRTCDLLMDNRHFNEQQDWKLPTFQPWYHYDTSLCFQQYFYIKQKIEPNKTEEWKNQQSSAGKMLTTWEEVCFRVFQRNYTPIPKCLWYYKLKYTQSGRKQEWKNLFQDTPFQSWGHAEGEPRDDERERGENTEEETPAKPPNPTPNHKKSPNPPRPKDPPNKPSNKPQPSIQN